MNFKAKFAAPLIFGLAISLTLACNTRNQEIMTTEDNSSIYPKGNKLSSDCFTGNAFLHPLVAKDNNNNFSAGSVTFEPRARTNWHTHPKGQVLLVIEGEGFYQEKGKPAQPIKKGEVVTIPEHVEHWHGASAKSAMTHIAITNYEKDEQVVWLQPVSEEEYNTVTK